MNTLICRRDCTKVPSPLAATVSFSLNSGPDFIPVPPKTTSILKMKIEGENGGLLTPTGSSAASNSSADEMIENENLGLRDRVADLEKKVIEQSDEITCLRSTLADALRRITALEASKGFQNHIVTRPTIVSVVDGGRIRSAAAPVTTMVRDRVARQASPHTPKRTASSYANHVNSHGSRKAAHHYQSTSSLYSDGHSSSSASPAPSPSPTSATTQQPRQRASAPQSTSLSKRWASATEFGGQGPPYSPSHLSPATQSRLYVSSPPVMTVGSMSSIRRNTASTIRRRPNGSAGGSLVNLSNLRSSNSQISISRHGRDAQYNLDEGIVKLYLRGRPLNLYVPSHLREGYHPQTATTPPSAKLKLEWVHGYRGRDCRSNLYQLPTGEIVYFVAAVVVLYNVEEQMQRHYLSHTDDIKCLAVHPNKLLIATGQAAGHDRRESRSWRLHAPLDPLSPEAEDWPHIRIWDSVSLNTLHILGIAEIERSVACLAFSKADGGNLLVAVDEAPDHNMSVWDWSRGERGFKLMETKCSADQVLAVDFSPVDRNTIITCGKSNITFWVYESGMLAKRMGIFEKRERPKYVTAISFTDSGNVISGDSNGNLLIWQRGGNTVHRSVSCAHDGAIFSIYVQKEGTIVTGGKDNKLFEWDRDLRRTNNALQLEDRYGAPRVITSGRGSRLLVGTTKNIILAGNFNLPLQVLMQGHTEEVWALAPHPSQQQFFTAGYDKSCYLWDSRTKSVVWSKDVGEYIQSAAFSKKGDIIIVGTTSGMWLVMDAETREMYSRHQDGNEPIQGHSSFVIHLDWSLDSQFIQSNSGDYEILFWNGGLCRQVVQTSQTRDIEWATSSCTLSFNTLGIWQDGTDGTDINSCNQANRSSVLAAGDDFGKIRLFSSPACYQKAQSSEYVGHSSHVTGVNFLHDDTRLISIGGRDTSIMQWIFSSRKSTL